VASAWSTPVHGFPLFQVCQKLKLVKANLKKLNATHFRELPKQSAAARAELFAIQNQLSTNLMDASLRDREKVALAKLAVVSKAEESFYCQKSRVQWLAEGDQNTSFFHNSIKCRLNENKLVSLTLEDGSRITDSSSISSEVVHYYHSLLNSGSSAYPGYSPLSQVVKKRLRGDQVADLEREVSYAEVKNTLFSLHSNKSPGPDGFNAFFFKRAWHIVGDDVVAAVQSFFSSGHLLKEVNNTYIALVPKVPNPSSLNDYRPISCCNLLYKCISKILANRIKVVLPSLIDPAQSAFIPGRKMIDNVLLAQELLHNYHRKDTSHRCAIKVDLLKAFDSVRWEYILDLLDLLGFPPRVVLWIQACISTPRFSVSINGEPQGFFASSKGIRQGDPVSPYLFVLAMDVLSMIIQKKVSEAGNFDFHWRCRRSQITHLCFADDLLLFCGGSVHSASILQGALLDFFAFSGLSSNHSKSIIFVAGEDANYRNDIVGVFGYTVGCLPVRYLGVPLITSRLRLVDCKIVVEKLTSRIKSWTSRFLSFAGRLQLIRSVLLGIQTHWASTFILPKYIIYQVEQVIRWFLWNGPDLKQKGAKVSWEDVTCPKKEGGLGIKKLSDWNKALMAKLIWNLCQPSSRSAWVNWVKVYLLKGRPLWDINTPSNCSWTWRKILQLRDTIRPFIFSDIGDGKNTSLWFDNWHPMGPLHPLFGDVAIYNSNLPRHASVASIIRGVAWNWPVANYPELHILKNAIPPSLTPSPNRRDQVTWLPSPSGKFTTRSCWETLRCTKSEVTWHSLVWFSKAIPKTAFILWLAIRGRLGTQDRLHIPTTVMCCLFCGTGPENHNHLFFECPVTSRIWANILARSGLTPLQMSWGGQIEWMASHWKGNSLSIIIYKLSLAASVYSIWTERNHRLHANGCRDVGTITSSILDLLRCKLSTFRRVKDTRTNRMIQQKWGLQDHIFV